MIVIAGAPESATLDWNEKSLIPVNEVPKSPKRPVSPSGKAFSAQWRQLATERLQMRPVLPKLDIDPRPDTASDGSAAEFFAPSEFASQESATSDASETESRPSDGSMGSLESTSEDLSAFYDHSFAIHEAIPSSQLSTMSDITPGTPTYESNEEMFPLTPATPGGIIRTPSQRRLSQAPRPKQLSELVNIPNANYLRSISPQTMTVNLVVGILSISPPRTVITGAKYGKSRPTELVELLVGDDTKSGFSITLWLPREMRVNWKDGAHATPEGSRSLLRRQLKLLRPRDVVLLQNVALSSFRGKVHGQSLRGDVTKIDLLFRKKVDENDMNGVYSVSNLRTATGKDAQIIRVKKVRDWLVNFVGEVQGKGRRRLDRGVDYRGTHRLLPDDTQ